MTQKTIEELDHQITPIGQITLWRRQSPSVPNEPVYEVRVDNQMLMSSSVNKSERALASLAVDRMGDRFCDVLVGGLGLGYTAAAALDFKTVRRLHVVELVPQIVGWHRECLLPVSKKLVDDPRCSLIEGDFFEYVGPSTAHGWMRYDVILADIDHSPSSLLKPDHAAFYTERGLRMLVGHLRDHGLFGLWSADEPDPQFLGRLRDLFDHVSLHEIPFHNPHMNVHDSNWIVIASLVNNHGQEA